jgi:hypothetical protein
MGVVDAPDKRHCISHEAINRNTLNSAFSTSDSMDSSRNFNSLYIQYATVEDTPSMEVKREYALASSRLDAIVKNPRLHIQ